jgi:predicted dehydrogenase
MSHPVIARARVALIGISGYGRIHLELVKEWHAQGRIRLVATTVINEAEEAEEVAALRAMGSEIFTDYETMLDAWRGRLELCLIPTGIHWHARMTIAALRAGANVLVEKPLSGVVAEVAAVEAAERETGRFVAVGFQDVYEPGSRWLKTAVHDGSIGELQLIRCLGLWPRPRAYFQRNGWAGRLRVDGRTVYDSLLSNAFAHFVMLGLFLAEARPDRAAAADITGAELWRSHRIESFDTAVVRLATASGVKLWFGFSHACATVHEPEIVITGSRGTAGWCYEREAWWQGGDGVRRQRALPPAHGARRDMMRAAVDKVAAPGTPVCTAAMAGAHTSIIERLHAHHPVNVFDPAVVRWTAASDEAQAVPTIDGLEDAMRTAYAAASSLGEVGLPTPPTEPRT